VKLIYNSFDFSTIGELAIAETREMEGGPDLPVRAKITLRVKVELFQRSYDANRQLIEQARAALQLPSAVLQWTNDAAGVDYANQTAVCLSHDLPEEWGEYHQCLNLVFQYYDQTPAGAANSLPLKFIPGGGAPLLLGPVFKWAHSAGVERFDPKRPHRKETRGKVHAEGLYLGDIKLDLATRRTALAKAAADFNAGMNNAEGLLQFGGGPPGGETIVFNGTVRMEEWNCEYDQGVNAVSWSFTASYTLFPDETNYATAEFTSDEKDNFTGETVLTVAGKIQACDGGVAATRLGAILLAVTASLGYDKGQPLTIESAPNTISANADGDTFLELSFTATYRKWRSTNRLATFTRTGGTAAIPLGNTRSWHVHYAATRFNEMRSQRRHATGSIEASGTWAGDMSVSLSVRRTQLDAAVNAMNTEVNNADGTLKYGNFSQVVRVDDFKAEVNQEETGVDWTLTASYSRFPNEGGYATVEFNVSQRADVESGDEFFSFTGRIQAQNGAAARAKLDTVRTSVLGIYGWSITQRLHDETTAQAIQANGDKTAGVSEGLEAATTDGTTFIELNWSEEYRRRQTGSLVSSTLQISQREDVPTQLLMTTYSGTVVAAGADADAAYATALAKAQALGAKRESNIDSTAYLRSSTISFDQRQTQETNPWEFVRLTFSYEYQSKLAAGRAYLELTTTVTRDTFGMDIESCQGFIAARDQATAQGIYNSVVRAIYTNRLIHSETTGFAKSLNQTGGAAAPPYQFNQQDLRLEFNLTVFSPKATGSVAFKYSVEVSRDFLALEMRTSLRGSCYTPDRPTADAALAALLTALNLGTSLRSVRNEDREYSNGGNAAPTLSGLMLKVDFEEEFVTRLTGVTGVLEMKLTEKVVYSGTRWAVQHLPFAGDGTGGISIPQPAGMEPGSRTISGSVTAAARSTAESWARQQRALLTGDAAGGHYPQPEQMDVDYEFVPRVDGISTGTGQNVKLWRCSFQFGEILPNYPA
jgi:hypothetical protein